MCDKFYKEGLHFDCNNCSMCCRFSGGVVLLSKEDLVSLASWAELTPDQFIKVYCRYIKAEDGLDYLCLKNTHTSKDLEDCIFWDKDIPGCKAYPARPAQCRSYPFWTKILESKDNWDKEKSDCPGINEGSLHTIEEIEEQLKLYQTRTPLTRQ